MRRLGEEFSLEWTAITTGKNHEGRDVFGVFTARIVAGDLCVKTDKRPLHFTEQEMTKKPYQKFKNEDEEQAFLDTANLEEPALTAGGAPMRKWLAHYEDICKDARANLRLPKALVRVFKCEAASRRMPARLLGERL
jgi:hypothetical protein